MKKESIRTLLIGLLALFVSTTVFAQSFEYRGIKYTIIDEQSVAVSNGSGYTDKIEIPSMVTYNGRDYAVTKIGQGAFDRCKRLTSLIIPNSVKIIGWRAFHGCWNLASISFPNNLKSISGCAIESTAWYNNQPNGLIYIGSLVYKYKGTMPANTRIVIKNGSLILADSIFYACGNMISVTIPNSVTSIGRGTFSRCSGLTSISIPNSVTSIGGYAFNDCSSLTSVSIPSSVISIGFNAFNGTPWYNNQANGLIYAGNVAYRYKGEMPSRTNITIKSGTLGIADYAFSGCSGLASVTIPNSVISIGGSAFSGCTGLTSITIPNSVTEIGNNAFQECSGLTSVNIPSSVITINEGAFRYCENLKTVSIPNSVQSIGPSAFYNCSKLSSVDIPNSITSIDSWTFEKCSSLTSVTIPNSVTSIGYSAFEACSRLTSITIPDRVKSIGAYAFVDCSSLSSFSFPNSLTSVGNDAFKGTSWYDSQPNGLVYAGKVAYKYKGTMPTNTHVSIKDGTILIANNAFSSCSGLTSVTIPNSVTSIGGSAFSNCSGLTSISLPNSVTEIGSSAFSSCTGLTSVTIPNRVLSVQSTTFYGCSSLVSITLPYGIEYIGRGSFSGCSSLTSITIPGSVTSMGRLFYSYVGYGAKALKTIVSEIERPFDISDSIVYDIPSNVELIVPYGTRATYLATEGWKTFRNITEAANKDEALFTIDGITYQGSKSAKTAVVRSVDINLISLKIPASVNYDGTVFQVTGIENNVFDGSNMGALIWDVEASLPSNAFTKALIGSNFLLYVKSASYAPSTVKNVVVNGTASSVVLSDDGGKFYCPQAFTARSISYTHNYSMETGGNGKGWETIALPFDVQKISHSTRGEIVPFPAYSSSSGRKPFWLANYSESGFRRTSAVLANEPYIIAMPNSSSYRNDYNLAGDVLFSAENVLVPQTPSFNGTFLPTYYSVSRSSSVMALNVNNRYVTYSGNYDAGSRFISNLRDVRPFEAYISGSSTRGVIEINMDGTTDMGGILLFADKDREIIIYTLSGRQVTRTLQGDYEQVWSRLPKGVYIVDGKKWIK